MPQWLERLVRPEYRREHKAARRSALRDLQAVRDRSGLSPWSGRDVPALARSGYTKNPIMHRCVRLIAETAASIPLTATSASVQALLDRPHADQSGTELLEGLYAFLHLSGNAYLELLTLEGRPREIVALRPDRMRVIPGARGWPDGWEYSLSGQRRRLMRDPVSGRSPVLHMKLFHPGDDHYGLPPVSAGAQALELHEAGSAWAKSLLDNAARPSGALVVGGKEGQLTPEQFDRLKAELVNSHSGAGNAGRPMLLEGGLDWKPMAMTPADMDFSAARREAAREIALAFGVPPLLLGLPGDNTYANYHEANLAFWRQTIAPLVTKTARALTAWLQPWSTAPLDITPDADRLAAMMETSA